MKKALSIILLVVMLATVFLAGGCGGVETTAPTQPSSTTAPGKTTTRPKQPQSRRKPLKLRPSGGPTVVSFPTKA